MNYLEMFIVVLAVVLLSTVAIMHHRNLQSAADLVTNASHTVQAMQLAQELFDHIDANLLANDKSLTGMDFESIPEFVHMYEENYPRTLEYYQATFDMQAVVENCDMFGNTEADPADEINFLVSVSVREINGQKDWVTLSRVFTQYTLENL